MSRINQYNDPHAIFSLIFHSLGVEYLTPLHTNFVNICIPSETERDLFRETDIQEVSIAIYTSLTQMELWNICEEITTKKDWYSKVFDPVIVSKWRSELPATAGDNFHMAIDLLRLSAQGVVHQENCDWDESVPACKNCMGLLRKQIQEERPGEELSDDPEDWNVDLYDWGQEHCRHPRCKCTAPDHELSSYVHYFPEGVLSKELHIKCQKLIADMAAKEAIDWHPGSDQQVRDLIHPSMYCYVKGVSKHSDGKTAEPVDESVRYQWLPSEFHTDGQTAKAVSYINNLDAQKYPKMTPLLEKVFAQFLPSLRKVLKDPLTNRYLQVIVKIGSIILTPEKPTYPGGSWHLEGMPHEHIAATCLHYVDMENISDSFLEFRKPTILNEEDDYPQSDHLYTTHHYGIEPISHHEGTMNRYLGIIRCHEGSSVIFPNIQHHVKDFSLTPGKTSSLRTILAFFVIDPNYRIPSTAYVPPQQGIMTLEEAQFHRERLMFHRKYFVDKLNEEIFERPFSLCEH